MVQILSLIDARQHAMSLFMLVLGFHVQSNHRVAIYRVHDAFFEQGADAVRFFKREIVIHQHMQLDPCGVTCSPMPQLMP